MVAVKRTRLSAGCRVRSHRQPPCCRWSKEIGGDSPAVIQGSDHAVPLWSALLESRKRRAVSAGSKGYRFPCKRLSSATILAEWAVTGDNTPSHEEPATRSRNGLLGNRSCLVAE